WPSWRQCLAKDQGDGKKQAPGTEKFRQPATPPRRLRSAGGVRSVLIASSSALTEVLGQSHYYYAKNHAVNDEHRQRAAAKVVEKEGDGRDSRQAADNDPENKRRLHLRRDGVLVLEQIPGVMRAGAENNGGREQE